MTSNAKEMGKKKESLMRADTFSSLKGKKEWKLLLENWRGVLLLFVLYTIQGIPMGLSISIPFLLQGRVEYHDLALFSLVSLPFSLKVLWAPLVDAWYLEALGRRKSWLLPVQTVCGLLMLWSSRRVDKWLQSEERPDVKHLSFFFICVYLLMATQDIAVDGWALTILEKNALHLSSACNAVGQTLGLSISYVGFLTLQDSVTCNRFFRTEPRDYGLLTLGSFLYGSGCFILACTCFAALYREKPDEQPASTSAGIELVDHCPSGVEADELSVPSCSPEQQLQQRTLEDDTPLKVFGSPTLGRRLVRTTTALGFKLTPSQNSVGSSVDQDEQQRLLPSQNKSCHSVFSFYRDLIYLLLKPSVAKLAFILLTCRFAFGPTDATTNLKLLEAGLPKEELALFGPLLLITGAISPIAVGYYTRGRKPLTWFLRGWRFRLIMSCLWMCLLPIVRWAFEQERSPSFWIYFLIFVTSALQTVSVDVMFSTQMIFFVEIADPSFGGTYMTLLNTIANLGSKWPGVLALYSFKWAEKAAKGTELKTAALLRSNAVVVTSTPRLLLDAYTVQVVCFCFLGLLWFWKVSPLIYSLEELPSSEWLIESNKKKS